MIKVHVRVQGFSLVEMALVLLIIGLLAKSATGPLLALQEHGKRQHAVQQLQQIREVLFAHLVAYGALPCPLQKGTSTTLTLSVMSSSGDGADICRVREGFIDAHRQRINGVVSNSGALLDPWGREYRYAVSLYGAKSDVQNLPVWTTPGEAAAAGLGALSSDIVLCNAQARGDCSGRSIRSDQIAFVVFSTASDNSSRGLQAENLDNDNYYLFAEESVVPGSEYDDLMVWGSVADVSYWMLRMGWLP